jgi:hypothetical protein
MLFFFGGKKRKFGAFYVDYQDFIDHKLVSSDISNELKIEIEVSMQF